MNRVAFPPGEVAVAALGGFPLHLESARWRSSTTWRRRGDRQRVLLFRDDAPWLVEWFADAATARTPAADGVDLREWTDVEVFGIQRPSDGDAAAIHDLFCYRDCAWAIVGFSGDGAPWWMVRGAWVAVRQRARRSGGCFLWRGGHIDCPGGRGAADG